MNTLLNSPQLASVLVALLNGKTGELLVALAMVALVLHFVATPLQQIPDKLDTVIAKLEQVESHLYRIEPIRQARR
jgi:hypothetical protein